MANVDPIHSAARVYRRHVLAALSAFGLLTTGTPAAALDTRAEFGDGLAVRGDGWRAQFGARLHADAAWFGPTTAAGAEDGFLLRRARVGAAAERGPFSARFSYEFGDVGPGWKNAWLQYERDPSLAVRLGSQTAPFGLEDTMSSDDLPFLERASVSALGPGLLTGIALRARAERWTFAAGAFGNNLSDDDRRQLDGRSVIARVTHVPYRAGPVLLHVGASGEFRDASDDGTFRLRPAIGTRVGDLRLLDTRRIDGVETLANLGIESGVRLGAILLQGEYVRSRLARQGGTDLQFDGWSAGGTWAVTGEQRRYLRGAGAFGGLERANRAYGVIELAVRYGTLDLQDADVDGGAERSLSVGVNWYPRENVRAMLSHVRVDADRGGRDLDAPDMTLLRLQVQF